MVATLRELTKSVSGATLEPITEDQYYEMMRTGILLEGSPIELIDGLIVRKDRGDRGGELMAGPRHTSAVDELNVVLRGVEQFGWHCRNQSAVALAATQIPEPDLSIIRGPRKQFAIRHPKPDEIAIVIEVSDTSLNYDRTTKQTIYAAAEIPIYWIVNSRDDVLEVYSHPLLAEGRYRDRIDYRAGETIALDITPGQILSIDVADLFPPRGMTILE